MTNLQYRDLVQTSRPKLEISKFAHFAEIQKIIVTTLELNFFLIFDIFLMCFGCFLRANTTEKKLVELQKFYKALAILSVSRQ